MSGIKYYALSEGEEPPEEFVVIRHVDGEPKFIASYINTNYLDYENGVLLKMHERNDVLRAENAKLLRLLRALALCADDNADCDNCVMNGAVYSSVRQTFCDGMAEELRAVGIEVDE